MEINRFGYYWLDTWVLANIIQLATQDFCTRFLNHTNDPCGRQYDQMTQAARSAPANIAEGNSRHSTSKETEMKLTDVARATLSVLANDYLNWLLRQESIPWSINSPEYKAVSTIRFDRPDYNDDVLHKSSIHIVEGGFTEGLTAERLSYRKQQSVHVDAPTCPLCGKPMIKRVAKKGINSGKEFWSCSDYPKCNGTKPI